MSPIREETVDYVVESSKSFYEACFDLEPVIQRLGFVTLHVHDLNNTSRRKELELDDECKVFDICNYPLTEKLLAIDMRLSLALSWRVSVFTDNGVTRIGMIRPQPLLAALSGNAEVARIAREIEEKITQIIDETR